MNHYLKPLTVLLTSAFITGSAFAATVNTNVEDRTPPYISMPLNQKPVPMDTGKAPTWTWTLIKNCPFS